MGAGPRPWCRSVRGCRSGASLSSPSPVLFSPSSLPPRLRGWKQNSALSLGISVRTSWVLWEPYIPPWRLGSDFKAFTLNPLKLLKGTQQGCPLSPLIFAIAIETLAIAIRTHPDIDGVKCGDQTHKCGLFADDLLLFITSPLTSLPYVCKLLGDFSRVSGLQVNLAKPQAMNISFQTLMMKQLKDSFNFKWSHLWIRYLGIHLTPKIEQLYAANYPPIFQELESDLRSWVQHELSWLGRIKSKWLPYPDSFTYSNPSRFQSKGQTFNLLRVIQFIWVKAGYRFSQWTLFNLRSQVGLGLPNLLWYYQVAILAQLSTVYSRFKKPDWV